MSNVDYPAELPTVLSLCTGYGGIERGLELAGLAHRTVAHVEIEAFAAANLVAKMEAGQLVPAPIWSDLKTLPAHCFRDRIDVLTGGYPCQPFSAAGLRKGADDPRHLWPYIYDHIRTIRPVRCFFENVEGHISLGLREVIADLESLGYATTWGVFSAAEVGAPHQRKRVYILAYASGAGRQQVTRSAYADETAHEGRASIQSHIAAGDGEGRGAGALADTNSAGQQPSEWQPRSPKARHNARRGGEAVADAESVGSRKIDENLPWRSKRSGEEERARSFSSSDSATNVADAVSQGSQGRLPRGQDQERQDQQGHAGRSSAAHRQPEPVSWATEPNVGRVVNGAAFRVDRLRLLGNGVVPQTAAKAWIVLNAQLRGEHE